jgi:putative ABC transport system permease protein
LKPVGTPRAPLLYRLLLKLLPGGFRTRFGSAMEDAFVHALSTSRRGGADQQLGLWVREAGDIALTAVRLRLVSVRDSIKGAKMWSWMSEIRTTLRGLARSPVFTTQTVLTVALGTVGVGAVYPLLQQVVLRPLPYEEPERLVTVRGALDQNLLGVTVPELRFLRERTDLFQGVAAVLPPQYDVSHTWTDRSPRERLHSVQATPSFTRVLGIDLTGPGFDPDATAGAEVLLSHGFWQLRFGGDPDVVGRSMALNDTPHTIVGILPEDFEFPLSPLPFDVWVVFRPDPSIRTSNDNRVFRAVARLRDGVSLQEASAQVPGLLRDFHIREATGIEIRRVAVRSLDEDLVGQVRAPLLLLMAAALVVLVVASLNLGLLISARNLTRDRELRVRHALGAGRLRLARFLLGEAGALALAGVILGGAVSGAVLTWVARTGGLRIARVRFASIGSPPLPVLALAVVLAVIVVAALVAAVRASGSATLGFRAAGVGRGGRRTIAFVVGVESALVFGLLVSAGLTLVSLEALTRVSPGFEPRGAVALEVRLPDGEYEGEEPARFFEAAADHLTALPEVSATGSVTHLPLDPANWGGQFAIKGSDNPPPDALPAVDWEFASPGYFEAAGIPLLQGRVFTREDRHEAPLVAIINETLARRYWPNGGAVGSRVNGNGFDGTWFTVVGVVGDVKQQGLEQETRGYMYMASTQSIVWPERQIVVRTASGDLASVVPQVRQALLAIEPHLTIGSVTPLDDLVHRASGAFRLRAQVFGAFGLIAVLLGMAGIYGVVSHGVQARRREVGVRLAVGADTNRVFRMILAEGLRPVLLGVAGGTVLVWVAGRWLEAFLYGVESRSPAILGAIAATLIAAALAAIVPPALRARQLDPVRVLQSE